ncbi:hypothetical protein TYRP_004821 [Tyrophagus putrescentiae]|nr:hypothetical protein TYRP_004821 [Tyrophagus putrescentiae]
MFSSTFPPPFLLLLALVGASSLFIGPAIAQPPFPDAMNTLSNDINRDLILPEPQNRSFA